MAGINANDIKVGNVINYKNNLWKVKKTMHVKPGKGPAYMQVDLVNIKTGSKLPERFRSQDVINRMEHESVDAVFLFSSREVLEFMRNDTFEQVSIPKEIAGEGGRFLSDGLGVQLETVEDEIIGVVLPDSVQLKVVETQPRIKGATVTATLKPATLENGVVINVPMFVEVGDTVKVKTETGDYVSIAN